MEEVLVIPHEARVIGIEDYNIYKVSDSWAVTIPSDTVKAIIQAQGEKKKYPVRLVKLSNGDILIKTSELLRR